MKSKANQIYFKYQNNPKGDVHTLPKKLIAKILNVWLQYWRGLLCFHLVTPFSLALGNSCKLLNVIHLLPSPFLEPISSTNFKMSNLGLET